MNSITAPINVNSESDDIVALRTAFRTAEEAVKNSTLKGRRRSLALDHLEISAMFAVKAAYDLAEEREQILEWETERRNNG